MRQDAFAGPTRKSDVWGARRKKSVWQALLPVRMTPPKTKAHSQEWLCHQNQATKTKKDPRQRKRAGVNFNSGPFLAFNILERQFQS